MSAFICNDYHISVLAYYAVTRNSIVLTSDYNAHEIGEILHAENVKSANHKYNESIKPHFRLDTRALANAWQYSGKGTVKIIKAVHCLDYQSCEHPQWESSIAFDILERIKSHATHNLPGYDQAEWEIIPPDDSVLPSNSE